MCLCMVGNDRTVRHLREHMRTQHEHGAHCTRSAAAAVADALQSILIFYDSEKL